MSRCHAWFLLLPSLLCGQTVSFLPPTNAFTSGGFRAAFICSTCLATADFNGDGNIDVVYSGEGGVPVAGVLLGNGDGTFRPGPTFNANYLGFRAPPVVGDFNGDGKPDLVFFSSSAAVSAAVFLNNGDGTFSAPTEVPACTSYPNWPDGKPNNVSIVAVADVNHDGKQDLVCGPTVLLSQGDCTFHAAPSALDGDVQLIADFNHDGNPDIVLLTETGQLAVVLGRGDGTFGADIPLSSPLNPPVQAGDFNGDGKIDLAGTSTDGTKIVVLPGKGDGTFGTPITTAGVPGPITAAGDFNGDGKLDLVAGDAILAGNGDGTFRFPVFVGIATQSCNPNYMTAGGLGCDYMHTATVVADFNGDGLPDLATGYIVTGYENASEFFVSVLLNDSPGDGFTATGVSAATGTYPVDPVSLVSGME